MEMQQAARRVAAENALLKHMLNEQGLNDEAIDSRVEQFWHDHSSASTPDDRASSSSIPPSFGSSGILVPQVCSMLLTRGALGWMWTPNIGFSNISPVTSIAIV